MLHYILAIRRKMIAKFTKLFYRFICSLFQVHINYKHKPSPMHRALTKRDMVPTLLKFFWS